MSRHSGGRRQTSNSAILDELNRIKQVLGRILRVLCINQEDIEDMAKEMDELVAEVSGITDGVAAANAALDGLSAQLDAAIATGDPAAVQKAADDLRAAKASLAEGIMRNVRPKPGGGSIGGV